MIFSSASHVFHSSNNSNHRRKMSRPNPQSPSKTIRTIPTEPYTGVVTTQEGAIPSSSRHFASSTEVRSTSGSSSVVSLLNSPHRNQKEEVAMGSSTPIVSVAPTSTIAGGGAAPAPSSDINGSVPGRSGRESAPLLRAPPPPFLPPSSLLSVPTHRDAPHAGSTPGFAAGSSGSRGGGSSDGAVPPHVRREHRKGSSSMGSVSTPPSPADSRGGFHAVSFVGTSSESAASEPILLPATVHPSPPSPSGTWSGPHQGLPCAAPPQPFLVHSRGGSSSTPGAGASGGVSRSASGALLYSRTSAVAQSTEESEEEDVIGLKLRSQLHRSAPLRSRATSLIDLSGGGSGGGLLHQNALTQGMWSEGLPNSSAVTTTSEGVNWKMYHSATSSLSSPHHTGSASGSVLTPYLHSSPLPRRSGDADLPGAETMHPTTNVSVPMASPSYSGTLPTSSPLVSSTVMAPTSRRQGRATAPPLSGSRPTTQPSPSRVNASPSVDASPLSEVEDPRGQRGDVTRGAGHSTPNALTMTPSVAGPTLFVSCDSASECETLRTPVQPRGWEEAGGGAASSQTVVPGASRHLASMLFSPSATSSTGVAYTSPASATEGPPLESLGRTMRRTSSNSLLPRSFTFGSSKARPAAVRDSDPPLPTLPRDTEELPSPLQRQETSCNSAGIATTSPTTPKPITSTVVGHSESVSSRGGSAAASPLSQQSRRSNAGVPHTSTTSSPTSALLQRFRVWTSEHLPSKMYDLPQPLAVLTTPLLLPPKVPEEDERFLREFFESFPLRILVGFVAYASPCPPVMFLHPDAPPPMHMASVHEDALLAAESSCPRSHTPHSSPASAMPRSRAPRTQPPTLGSDSEREELWVSHPPVSIHRTTSSLKGLPATSPPPSFVQPHREAADSTAAAAASLALRWNDDTTKRLLLDGELVMEPVNTSPMLPFSGSYTSTFEHQSPPLHPQISSSVTGGTGSFASIVSAEGVGCSTGEREDAARQDVRANFLLPFDEDNKLHLRLLEELWRKHHEVVAAVAARKAVATPYPRQSSQRTPSPGAPPSSSSPPPPPEEWETGSVPRFQRRHATWCSPMGFQQEDPVTDFRGGGVFSLLLLVLYVTDYPKEWAADVAEGRASGYYPAATSINISFWLSVQCGLRREVMSKEQEKLQRKQRKKSGNTSPNGNHTGGGSASNGGGTRSYLFRTLLAKYRLVEYVVYGSERRRQKLLAKEREREARRNKAKEKKESKRATSGKLSGKREPPNPNPTSFPGGGGTEETPHRNTAPCSAPMGALSRTHSAMLRLSSPTHPPATSPSVPPRVLAQPEPPRAGRSLRTTPQAGEGCAAEAHPTEAGPPPRVTALTPQRRTAPGACVSSGNAALREETEVMTPSPLLHPAAVVREGYRFSSPRGRADRTAFLPSQRDVAGGEDHAASRTSAAARESEDPTAMGRKNEPTEEEPPHPTPLHRLSLLHAVYMRRVRLAWQQTPHKNLMEFNNILNSVYDDMTNWWVRYGGMNSNDEGNGKKKKPHEETSDNGGPRGEEERDAWSPRSQPAGEALALPRSMGSPLPLNATPSSSFARSPREKQKESTKQQREPEKKERKASLSGGGVRFLLRPSKKES